MNRGAFRSGSGDWVLWLVGLGLMVLESAILAAGVGQWMMVLQTPLVLIVYVGVTRNFAAAAVMSALWLPVADLLSGGPPGVIAFGLTGVFFAVQSSASRLRLPWGSGHWLVSVGAAILFAGVVTLVLSSLSAFSGIRSALLGSALVSVLSIALFGWPLGRILQWLDEYVAGGVDTSRRSRSRLNF